MCENFCFSGLCHVVLLVKKRWTLCWWKLSCFIRRTKYSWSFLWKDCFYFWQHFYHILRRFWRIPPAPFALWRWGFVGDRQKIGSARCRSRLVAGALLTLLGYWTILFLIKKVGIFAAGTFYWCCFASGRSVLFIFEKLFIHRWSFGMSFILIRFCSVRS